MLTQFKADQISEYLSKDIEHTKELLDMEPELVLNELKAAGIECELEELVENGDVLNKAVAMSQKNELNEEDLEQVAGGVAITAGLILGLAGCLVAGAAVGGAACIGHGAGDDPRSLGRRADLRKRRCAGENCKFHRIG